MLFGASLDALAWWKGVRTRGEEDRGASAVEYALMLALIAAVIVTAVTLLGQNTSQGFDSFATQLSSAGS